MTNRTTIRTPQGNTQTVTVGDWVGFKADVEQVGRIAQIIYGQCTTRLILTPPADGFEGYAEGEKEWTVDADECWALAKWTA